ncbi:hypothetical protein RJ640_030527 [Escallonia rubra]|uniref:Uncharacterized protein n=1 Tax=Escallonia rubra TaxID=112253 RepID=A0AA88QMT0_9ASTE|nr:hypothetical protein RJ640_030527 [Escallonia rubra]
MVMEINDGDGDGRILTSGVNGKVKGNVKKIVMEINDSPTVSSKTWCRKTQQAHPVGMATIGIQCVSYWTKFIIDMEGGVWDFVGSGLIYPIIGIRMTFIIAEVLPLWDCTKVEASLSGDEITLSAATRSSLFRREPRASIYIFVTPLLRQFRSQLERLGELMNIWSSLTGGEIQCGDCARFELMGSRDNFVPQPPSLRRRVEFCLLCAKISDDLLDFKSLVYHERQNYSKWNREHQPISKSAFRAYDAQNNINTKFILLDKARVTLEGQQKICLALVADETAAVHFQLWGDECDAFETGDIIHLANGIFSYNRNNLVLRSGKRGRAEKVGEFTMAFVETPNLSEIRWVPDSNNSKKYVQEARRKKNPPSTPPSATAKLCYERLSSLIPFCPLSVHTVYTWKLDEEWNRTPMTDSGYRDVTEFPGGSSKTL